MDADSHEGDRPVHDGAPLRPHAAEAMDRWLDASLGETLGGERAPDVTASVLARAAAGERPALDQDDVPVAGGAWRQLWLAALLFLGIGVVGGVAWLQRAGAGGGGTAEVLEQPATPRDGVASTQDPERDGLVFVRSRSEIADLPTDLRAARVDLGKRGLAELVARCPRLEVLLVVGEHPDALAFRMSRGLGRSDQDAEPSTAELVAQIAHLTDLQELSLGNLHDADGAMGPLRNLKQLHTLALQSYRGIDADGAAVLASLQTLRSLRIDCMERPILRTLMEAIRSLSRLEQLELRAQQGAEAMDTTPLASLTQLREFRIHLGTQAVRPFARGVHDEFVQEWPRLRTLSMPDSGVTARFGDKLLVRTPALTDLDLGGCTNLDLGIVRDVVKLPHLRKLRIAGVQTLFGVNPDLGPDTVALLAPCPSLREVDLGIAPWFTLEHAATLLAAGKKVRIEREDAAFQLQLADLHRQHTYRQIHSVTDVKALTSMVTHVQLRSLGDRAAVALGACPWLEVVEFVRDDEDPLTAIGLDAVLALPALRRLDIVGIGDLPADALRSLAEAKALQTLSLTGCAVGDDVLGALPSLPKLRELHLLAVRGFGDVGMRGIVGCRLLSSLTLSSCKHLTTEQLALVGELRGLTRLALADLPNLRDRAVMPLQHLLGLGDLDLTRGPFTSKAMQALDGLPMLRRLVLTECSGLVTSALLHVPTSVQDLDLTGCRLDATAPVLLRDRFPKLRMLRLWNADWLDDDGFRALLAAPSLRQLIAGDCTKMTPVHADAIRAAKRLISLDVTRSTCLRDEDLPGLAADRPDLKVVRKVW